MLEDFQSKRDQYESIKEALVETKAQLGIHNEINIYYLIFEIVQTQQYYGDCENNKILINSTVRTVHII